MVTNTLDVNEYSDGPLPDQFSGPKIWTGKTLGPAQWTIPVNEAVVEELMRVTSSLRREHLPVYMLRPGDFDLAACTELMAQVRAMVHDGQGFAIVDRLPLDSQGWSEEESKAIFWLLCNLMSHPVAQSFEGKIFQDIRDKEKGAGPETVANAAVGRKDNSLGFHQDNSGNRAVPDYTALLAINAAEAGGVSEYCSLYSVYNAMATEAREHLLRLFQPFYHDRLGNNAPNEPETIWAPAVRSADGRLYGRISMKKIPDGYRKVGKELDSLGLEALETINRIIRRDDLSAKYGLERGQVVVFSNREGMHYRSAFQDGSQPSGTRHLVRLWLRDEGKAFFDG